MRALWLLLLLLVVHADTDDDRYEYIKDATDAQLLEMVRIRLLAEINAGPYGDELMRAQEQARQTTEIAEKAAAQCAHALETARRMWEA